MSFPDFPFDEINDTYNSSDNDQPSKKKYRNPTTSQCVELPNKQDNKDKFWNSLKATVKIIGPDDNPVQITTGFRSCLNKAVNAYAQHINVPAREIRFILDGERLSLSQCPLELGWSFLLDGRIDAFLEQVGG